MNAKLFSEFMQQSRICILGIMDNLNVSVTYELVRILWARCGLRYWCYELFGLHGTKCDGGDLTAILTHPDFGFDYYYKSESKVILGELDDLTTSIFAGTSSLAFNHSCLEKMQEKCMLILIQASDYRQKNEIALYGYTPIRDNLRKNYSKYAADIRDNTMPICDIIIDATRKNGKQIAEEIYSALETMLDASEDYIEECSEEFTNNEYIADGVESE